MTCHNTLVLFRAFFVPVGKTVPKLDLIRKHLMIEGQIEKDCLVRILNEVTDIYRKFGLAISENFLYANFP